MASLGACLIVKNEEVMLGQCLDSLKGFDSIVVCDTGSTDKTIEIAKRYTDKVYTDFTWCDSFCKARNHALSKATADWIYTIDADEHLISPVSKVREWAEKAEKNKWLSMDVWAGSGKNDAFLTTRLCKRDKKVFWNGDIHNHLSVLGEVVSDIQHYVGYSPAHKLDPDRALRILTRVVAERPDCVREKFYLAREHWYRKDYKTAINWYVAYLKVAHFASEMADANLMLAHCHNALGDWNTAKDFTLQAIKINTNYKEALEFMASLSGPGNKKRWLEFAETATNEAVLFINSAANDIPRYVPKKAVHYCDGMKTFGDSLVRDYGYKKYDPETDTDMPTLFEGLYFQQDYDLFRNHQGRKTVYWNGSDVLRLLGNPEWIKILKDTPAKHLCGSAAYVTELATVGIAGKHSPLFFGDVDEFELSYKQSDTPQVYMTVHPEREDEYGLGMAMELARETGVVFHIYGMFGEESDNIVYHGQVDSDVMDKEIKEYQGAVKLIARDGLSQTVAKSALMGQYPIAINKIDGVWTAATKKELARCLNSLKDQKKPNHALRNKYRDIFSNARSDLL